LTVPVATPPPSASDDRYDLVIRARRGVTPEGIRPVAVAVRGGRIAVLATAETDLRTAAEVRLADDEVLLPGLVDSHVHVNEPGRTEWEGFTTATRAAAAGGVTTIIDMPLNSIPPTVNVAALARKRAVAGPLSTVDVGFWGGAVPGNLADLEPLYDAGVYGFKCFLLDSGVAEFPPLDATGFEAAMAELARLGAPMVVHAEDPHTIAAAPPTSGRDYLAFVASRPPEAELRAIDRVLEVSRRTGARAHILHLSSAMALPQIAAARADGVPVTVETCPHYLTLSAEEVPPGATAFKCCPPIRDAANRDLLWEGLRNGTIDLIVSDHSPTTVARKCLDSGDFGQAWGGVASLQLGLSVMWTDARARGLPLEEVVRWMSTAPARFTGLNHKGAIAAGYDADLVAFAPEAELVVEPHSLHHRNPVTPYAGRRLHGIVRQTWLRGRRVDPTTPHGILLSRGQS
jgi:allantoinase